MDNRLSLFSNFVRDVHSRAETSSAHELAHWAAKKLARSVGFDAAWYGWAQVDPKGVNIHANATLNLPDDYYETWSEISQQDLLAAGILERPGHASHYDRKGDRQTDGMVALSDKFGLTRMATAMHMRTDRAASFYLSGYRTGRTARAWSPHDLEFLQCAIDQLSDAMRTTPHQPGVDDAGEEITVFVNPKGISIHGLNALRMRYSALWPDWDGRELPSFLRPLIDRDGAHILADRKLHLNSAPAGADGMGLRRLTLRPLSQLDRLTPREREVARVLASGHSHKETARQLGVAPATIRNQTRSIYDKLGIDNRTSLAVIVQRAP